MQSRVEHVARDLALVERTAPSTWSDTPLPDAQRTLASAQDSLSRELRALRAALDTRTRAVVEEAERRDRRERVIFIGLSVAAIAVGLLATALSAPAFARYARSSPGWAGSGAATTPAS